MEPQVLEAISAQAQAQLQELAERVHAQLPGMVAQQQAALTPTIGTARDDLVRLTTRVEGMGPIPRAHSEEPDRHISECEASSNLATFPGGDRGPYKDCHTSW